MAKFNYQKTLATSQRLINKFGNPITMTRAYNASQWDRVYDPVTESFTWTNTTTGASQSTEPADEVTIADGALVGIDEELLENSLVKKSDSKLLVVGIDEPQVGDTFIVNGKVYAYIAHISINPAGVNVLYKVALRI
jgi:hypothetical protein